MDRFPQRVQDSFCVLFLRFLSRMFKQKHIIIREKISALNFLHGAEVKFHALNGGVTELSEIYHDQMDTIEVERTGNNRNLRIFIQLNILVRAGKSFGSTSEHARGCRQAKERPQLFWPSSSFSVMPTARRLLLHVSDDQKTWLFKNQAPV